MCLAKKTFDVLLIDCICHTEKNVDEIHIEQLSIDINKNVIKPFLVRIYILGK